MRMSNEDHVEQTMKDRATGYLYHFALDYKIMEVASAGGPLLPVNRILYRIGIEEERPDGSRRNLMGDEVKAVARRFGVLTG